MKKDLSRSMMFLNLYKRHLIGLVALMLLCSLNLFGQTYRTHYIAPASWSYFSNANELVVATNSTTPINVTVNRSDGTFVTTLSVSSGAPVTYRFTGSTGSAPRNANNTVLSGVGLIVSADEPISVSIRNVASDSSGPDANIKGNANLFSFGDPAIGTSFRIGYYRDGILDTRDGRNHYPVYSVMALEDNTTVSRNGTVLTTLNAGQSYLFEGQYIGALIESSGPVVMNMGAHYDRPYGGCFDGASNQMVPTASLANDYFVIRGNGGSGTDGAVAEQTTVVATAANTVVNLIHYNASGAQVGASSFTLNNPGDFQSFEHGVNGQQFSSTRITTTQSIAAYSGVASGCEIEAYTLAPLSECGGSQHVQNVRFTNFNSGTLPYFGYVFLPLSSPAAVVELNGVDIMTHTGVNRVTLGASGYELITFTNEAIGSPTNIVLISDVRMTIGMIQSGAGFSMASFLTPFPEQALQPQINTSGGCALNTLTADAGHSNYQWYLNGSPIRGANSHTYEALISGSYSVSYTLDCGPGIQSLPVAVNLCADLGVVKEVSNMAPAVGSEVTFTITATNHGPSNATGVSVTDILPSGYTYVSHNAVPSTSAYNFNTGLWSIGAMGLDATATLTITATVRPTGEYANTATIQGAQNDENVDNNVSSVTPVPLPYIALTSANETDNQLLCLGETLETITYQVGGSATGVNLSGSLPAGVTGAFDPATRIYTITGTPTVLGTFSYTLTTTGGTGAAAELTGTITVNPIPSVDNQTVTVCSGDTFFITPTGVPAGTTYTWGDPVITGSVTGASAQATGQTSIGQTLTNTGNGVATVVYTVTPTSGTCVGEPFTVTVTVSPENTITPPAVTEFCGGTTEGTDLTIVGTDLGPGVTYKWQINTNPNDLNNPWGYDDIDIPGADGKDYNPGTLTATGTGFRRMVVAGAPSCVDESSNIVRFIVMPVINNVIVPSTILENCGTINEYDIGGTLTGGNNNNFTFQWQRSTDGISWTDIPGADGQQYNPNTVTAPTYFRRIAYSGNGYIYNFSCESISNVLFYNTNATPATPGSITGEAVVCSPASSQSYSIAAVSGATSYTWSYSGTGVTINGTGTSVTLTFAANATSGTLSVVANGACGESNPSELAITVTAAPVITTQPAGNTYCEGETITALQVVASGGTGYQWYSNTTASNTGGVLIGGATSATYTPTVNAPETYYYYVVVSGDGACSTTSGVATITINEETTITGQPQASAVYCVDESATALGVMASGTGTLGYQWYSNTTNSNTGGTAIAGATSSTYTPSTATSGTYYYYVVVSSDCGTASSTVSTVTVNEETTITGQPQASAVYCVDESATALVVTASGTGTLGYQWYSNTTASTTGGTAIAGATSATYTPSTATSGTYYYYVVVSSDCEPVASDVATVTVNAFPVIDTQPQNVRICADINVVSASVTASLPGGDAGTLTYQWQISHPTVNAGEWFPAESLAAEGVTVVGANTATATLSNIPAGLLHESFDARGRVVISNGTCSVISNAIDLVIDPNPVGSDDNTSVDCTGELNYNLQANVDNAMEANTVLSTFTWTVSSNPNVSGASAGSGSTISQTLINTSTTAQVVTYTVTPTSVTGGCAGATFTVTVTVPACADVSVVKAVSNASPNVGEEVTFTIAVSNAGPSPAASVTVSDALPTGYTLGTINDGGTETGGTITWSVGTLSAGSTATVSFTATVDEEGSYANTAVASSPTSDPDPDNNESTVTPEPIASPSLLLEKVGTLESDGTIAYTFTVTNTGNVTISGIAVSDDKIAAAIELGATELAPGASTTGTAVYTPTEDELVAGQVVNQATVTGEDPDGGSVGPVDSDDPTTPEVGDPTIVATGVLAVDDEGSANGHTGGTAVSNILDNDRLSGAPATTDNVDVSFVSSTHSGITLEGTSVVVALGTPAGTYELVYEIADLANPSNRQQATVTVIVTTDELEAVDDQGSVGGQAGGTAVTNVLANDIYNGGAPGSATTDNVSIEQVSSSHSGITLNGTDVVVAPGTPAGEYELVYRITDLLDPSKTSEATVRVTVWDGPVANDDAVTVPNDGTTSIDVLGNDEEGSSPIVPGSVTIVTGPEHGTATVNADGTVTYTPNEGYTGDDSFTYTVSDENGLTSNEATVNITVEASVPEVPPVANNDAGTVTENGTIAIDVLGNDEEGSSPIVPGSVTIVTGPEHGTVTVNADGTVTYTPNEGYSGNDSFTYTVSDENGLTSNEATVNITVEATLPPVANNDTGTVTENGTVAIDVLGNDEAGSTGLDPGSVTIVVEPEHGTVTVNADGTVTYTPNEGYTGDDSFTYTVAGEDGKVSNEATVGITVRPTVPVANDDSATTEFNTPVTVNVLANDEADVSPLDPGSVTITFGPSHGTVVVNADGTVTYTPEPGYTGSDSFGYTVRDANGNVSNEATVRVEVTGFFIPNVFTPNGDGINDRFQIVGREQFDRIELNVFNRWGGEVYSNENYRDEWDGNNLNEGTYYYLIKTHREGRTEVHKGWVLLKRR